MVTDAVDCGADPIITADVGQHAAAFARRAEAVGDVLPTKHLRGACAVTDRTTMEG
ncbi:hypothetical protein [Rhizomonospora bruguierae]|uniref:hypothetical protein n=1 Tax=Rhizomonospora bruguierae TaxID=1581705 RepID=UPI001BCC55A5|nr:hypothetical protein [Micromonospora sp. NBRC 107566]